MARVEKWVAASQPWDRLQVKELAEETVQQVVMDFERTYAKMLVADSESDVAERRQTVSDLMMTWLKSSEKLTYMQGMNHVMATCFRELEDEQNALRVFDFVVQQANENLFHRDPEKLFLATHELAETLHSMIREASPSMAKRLAKADIDFMPMIVQNWLIDLFLHVLPPSAATRVWDHMMDMPGIPVKFASQLLLSGKQAIMDCDDSELQEVLASLPEAVTCPEEVDMLLAADFKDVPPEAEPPIVPKMPEMLLPLEVLEVPKVRRVRLPRRWQPWKFVSVAMVIPWLLVHATQLHAPRLNRRSPPAATVRKASLPAVLHVVPMHEANWPK